MFQPHWVHPHSCICAFPIYTAQAPGCPAGNCLRQALGGMKFPGLSHSSSGSPVLHKGADSVGPAFCAFPGPSSSGARVLGEHSHPQVGAASSSLPHPSRSVFWVCNRPGLSGVLCLFWGADLWLRPSRWMLTIQNPKKSWLATKPACSLVQDASLGP